MAEQLFASFILDRDSGLEIAITAESVTEATPLTERIQPLPASVPFLEGTMRLRDQVIPVLNLKKRLGLNNSDYDENAKIAVIILANQRFGLLFDDIREVLRVDESLLLPIQPALQSEDFIISKLITLGAEHRTLEVLDLNRLFKEGSFLDNECSMDTTGPKQATQNYTYSRYVIFTSDGREYGIPVENSREITFLADIDDTFSSGCLEGALQLRGRTIPVMNADALLKGTSQEKNKTDELSRILVMHSDTLTFGIIIDEIREILTVTNEKILPMPVREEQSVKGIYEPESGRNIMLLDVNNLIASQVARLESMARIKTEEAEEEAIVAEARHLITENCYLIFSISKNFAIELKDVQEILEPDELLRIPSATGFDSEVINLRGKIIPVINLRTFYGYPDRPETADRSRLIICRDNKLTIALQVDTIKTIYKQEQFHSTPSLNPQLQPRKDTLDHLIEFMGDQGVKEHVLVVNTQNLIRNHLQQGTTTAEQSSDLNDNTDIIDQSTDSLKGGE